jgi:hypothetical protein
MAPLVSRGISTVTGASSTAQTDHEIAMTDIGAILGRAIPADLAKLPAVLRVQNAWNRGPRLQFCHRLDFGFAAAQQRVYRALFAENFGGAAKPPQ